MTEYTTDPDVLERIEDSFVYHPPKGDQVARYRTVRNVGLAFSKIILANTPPGGEQDTAIERLNETVMWANAAIARGE